jgi:hypothetical protein
MAIVASAYVAIPPEELNHGRPSPTWQDSAVQANRSCIIRMMNPLSICPVPPAVIVVAKPALAVCPRLPRGSIVQRLEPRPSLCGTGFHPHDRVYVLASSEAGSTLWAVRADAGGAFNSLLPSPLCRVTPATVSAIDMHGGMANSLTLRGIPCPRG